MTFDVQLHLSSKKYECLCFTHAIQEAMKNEQIYVDVDDYEDDHCMAQTWCQICLDANYPWERSGENE